MPDDKTPDYDAVIVGGGHNGLTAAAYLAQAGCRVLVLERDDHVGGAAVSAQAFEGVDARLSRYAYLVSLLPQRIIDDLGLDISLVRRRYSSYTPDPLDPTRGLLVDRAADAEGARADFARAGVTASDLAAWDEFSDETRRIAEALFPTLTEPLPTRAAAKALLGDDEVWDAFIERPLGATIDARFRSDLVRGVVATDGLIGTFTSLDDPALDANRCFLYHVIGGGTGDWDVPVGGMGAVSGEIARAAASAGATVLTGAEALSVVPASEAGLATVQYRHDGELRTVAARTILSNVAPAVLDRLLGDAAAIDRPGFADGAAVVRPEGAQAKVNLFLTRLPKLRDETVATEAAFAGTFHINELGVQLQAAFERAEAGELPDPMPCEIYCHTLSDRTILGESLRDTPAQTLTLFGLHVPDRLVDRIGNDELRDRIRTAVLASLNSVLAEPIEDVLAIDATGKPCIEVKTTRDLEEALAMPGGNIFHGPLSWPWAEDDAELGTPAQRWGVATRFPDVLLCGSGAVRGGAVSGIGGHNAAMAVLEADAAG
ncbi:MULTISPECIES: phytoene desaturase family protein [unclassified Microbacterium]|uniref:phytoene desaturase family protein n=1 Tax=unclassified Microbacterium TaxID=2609290 RepID=UPI0036676B77